MAIPSSGTLSMVKIARERKYSNYNGSQTMGTISMYDLINGGNTNGSTISYPAINNQPCNDPIEGSASLPNFEDAMGTFDGTAYYNSNIGIASNLSVGDYLYSNTALTTPLANIIWGFQIGSSSNDTICGQGFRRGAIETNAQGMITDAGTCVSYP